MTNNDRVRLLFGPYTPPQLKKGERAYCLYRDTLVVIVGWSSGRISWPCRYMLDKGGNGNGLLVDDELARAIKHESGKALCYWWGISRSTAERWRRAFHVGRMDAEGTKRLVLAAIRDVVADHRPPPNRPKDEVIWSPEEIALLGVLLDQEVAERTGRTVNAVRCKRLQLGRDSAGPHGGMAPGKPWTREEEELVLSLPLREAAARIGRTFFAAKKRRCELRKAATASSNQ